LERWNVGTLERWNVDRQRFIHAKAAANKAERRDYFGLVIHRGKLFTQPANTVNSFLYN
jgi:hypothetical protein